jgi:hypothetical protein
MKARRTRKVQKNRMSGISDAAFADLKEALEDSLAFERGDRRDLSVTRIQVSHPPREDVLAFEHGKRGLHVTRVGAPR